MIKDLKRLYTLLNPYFGLSGANLKRSLALTLMVISNLAGSFIFAAINAAFEGLLGALGGPGLTYTIFFGHVLQCCVTICVYATSRVANWALASWLGESLGHQISKLTISKWMQDKSFYGLKFLDNQNHEKLDPASVIESDIDNITNSVTSLVDSWISHLFNFMIGAYWLTQYSIPLTVQVASMSLVVPGYMFIGAVTYAIGYTALISLFDRKLREEKKQLRAENDRFSQNLHHVYEHGESIAMKQGGARERFKLLKSLKELTQIRAVSRVTSGVITFLQVMHDQLNFIFGLVLSAPGIMAGKIESTLAFSVASFFSNVVQFFTWKKDHTEQLASIQISTDRLEAFQNLMTEWDALKQSSTLQRGQGLHFQAQDLSLHKPNGQVILEKARFELKKGTATIIQGPSGIGKTTLFRSLANLWPYVSGEVTLPQTQGKEVVVEFIPQKAYFPLRSSLLEAILYPNEPADLRISLRKIHTLMREIGLEAFIDELDTVKEWAGILSGGQQQRVALLGAILRKPDVLFMDEGTGELDFETRTVVERCLKKYLPNTTIVAIDHRSLEPVEPYPFFTHRLVLEKEQGEEHARMRMQAI